MLSLQNEIHFWSTNEDISIKNTDYKASKYCTKKEHSDYFNCKKQYLEIKGLKCHIPNKRPEKLKEKLQELEEALFQYRIIHCHWKDNDIKLLLSRGLIVHIKLTTNGYPHNINFDKSLSVKIQNELIVNGVIINSQVVVICKDGRVFGYGGLCKDCWTLESGSRKYLSLHDEWLVIWGKTEVDHPQPWSPIAKDHQRANLHLYWIGSRGPDLLSYKKTDAEPIKVVVSRKTPRSLIVVEQKISQRGQVSVEVCLLELVGNVLKRMMVTLVPLQTQVCSSALSHNENYLILGCIDGSLALLDRNKGSTRTIKISFIPAHLAWHCSESLMVVANEKGHLQYYDIALNCLAPQLNNEDFADNVLLDVSSYMQRQQNLENVFWGPTDILLCLNQGPLVSLKFVKNSLSFLPLMQTYLNLEKYEQAIGLLLNWDFDECAFIALQKIVTLILKLPLTEATAQLLQKALGCFHCPAAPLRTETKHKYGPQVKNLTRKFFHQLVRTKMYEMAFLLAVDLGHHDLFMDLYHIAVKIGETEMAAAARAQASSLLSRCSSDASYCSKSSCSQCSDSSNESNLPEEENTESKTEPSDYLSTNFNNPIPKTYKTYVPPIPNIDLPKIRLPNKNIPVPPLPVAAYNNIGIPLIPPSVHPRLTPTLPPRVPYLPPTTRPKFPPPREIPPLPVPSVSNIPNVNSASSSSKKAQAKVKFSDTVTAFIVPEVKRPLRPAPPAHVTDPQKELADSLPLCHPNEDYLKDFAPIRREQNDSPPTQPKITVVHFGVV